VSEGALFAFGSVIFFVVFTASLLYGMAQFNEKYTKEP
jgi:hypothetical protein